MDVQRMVDTNGKIGEVIRNPFHHSEQEHKQIIFIVCI